MNTKMHPKMNTKPKCEDEAIIDETIMAELDEDAGCKQKIAALEAQVEVLKQQVAGYNTQPGVEAEMLKHWIDLQTDDGDGGLNYLDKEDLHAGIPSLLEQHKEYLNAVRAENKLQVMMAERFEFRGATTNIRFIPGDGTSPTFEILVYDKHNELVGAFKWFKNLAVVNTWVPNIDDTEDVDEGEEQDPVLSVQPSFKAAFKVWMKWYKRNY